MTQAWPFQDTSKYCHVALPKSYGYLVTNLWIFKAVVFPPFVMREGRQV